MALPKLLVELGVFEICGAIFLQLHHSKEISDRYFGIIERLVREIEISFVVDEERKYIFKFLS